MTAPRTEDRVRRALHGTAARLEIPEPSHARLDATRERHDRRARRATSIVAIVALLVGAGGAWSLLDTTPGVQLAAGSSPTTFTWTAGEHLLSGIPQPVVIQGPDGVLYALSTAPGQTLDDGAPPTPAVYRSADGTSWELVSEDDVPDLATLDVAADGLLYGLTTAPGGVVHIASSADGTTWQEEPLNVTIQPPSVEEGIELNAIPATTTVVETDGTRVATITQSYLVSEASVLSADEQGTAYTQATEQGLAVIDAHHPEATEDGQPEAERPSPRRIIAWGELGLEDPGDLVVTHTFVSEDGGQWEELEPVDGHSVHAVLPAADGMIAVLGGGDQPVTTATSDDGRTWTVAEEPLTGIAQIEGADTVAGRPLVVTREDRDVAVHTSTDDGRTWTTTRPAIGLAEEGTNVFVGQAVIGPLGIAMRVDAWAGAVGEESPVPEATGLLFSPNGQDFQLDTGDVIAPGGLNRILWLAVGADRILVDAETAQGRQTFVGVPAGPS